MGGGTYVLKVRNTEVLQLTVGSLGKLEFEAGWFAYVGSSRTTNFSRVERHIELSEGERDTRHWHIDYLLGSNKTKIESVYKSESDVECDIAQSINIVEKSKFGCSDCSCSSHLFYSNKEEEFERVIQDSFELNSVSYGVELVD